MALADIDSGNYQGVDQNGGQCQVVVGEVTFEGGVRHPLNERLEVELDGVRWTLSHKKVVDEDNGTVRFDHNYFEGTIAVARNQRFGAQYLKITIDHDAEPHRPVEFIYLNDDYKDNQKNLKQICSQLQKI